MHWVGVKNILRYLQGTKDLGLFYQKNQERTIVGYSDAGYLSNSHNARSHTGFVFVHGGTAFSWKSTKQTLVATSMNHSEIIALYEASRECVCLRRMMNLSKVQVGLVRWNHPLLSMRIMQPLFYRCKQVILKAILQSILLLSYFIPVSYRRVGKLIFCKQSYVITSLICLPSSLFHKYVYGIGMRRFRDLQNSGGEIS
jgi:hypothetical protein